MSAKPTPSAAPLSASSGRAARPAPAGVDGAADHRPGAPSRQQRAVAAGPGMQRVLSEHDLDRDRDREHDEAAAPGAPAATAGRGGAVHARARPAAGPAVPSRSWWAPGRPLAVTRTSAIAANSPQLASSAATVPPAATTSPPITGPAMKQTEKTTLVSALPSRSRSTGCSTSTVAVRASDARDDRDDPVAQGERQHRHEREARRHPGQHAEQDAPRPRTGPATAAAARAGRSGRPRTARRAPARTASRGRRPSSRARCRSAGRRGPRAPACRPTRPAR